MLHLKRILFIVLTITLMLNTVSCMKASNSENEEKIGIRGQITKVLMDNNKVISAIMVEGKVESDTIYDKARVGIDKGTKIYTGNAGQKLSASELKEGMKVEVVFEGPVAESYPVQGKAKTIKVID
ncbi:MAG: YobA family protein [Clostridia bacterium]|nr:YobA family protein [Clostridia bacterium]